MLDALEVSRSFMKRMKSTGKMTEPWGTPALIDCRLERKLSTLTAIHLSEGKQPIHLMKKLFSDDGLHFLEMSEVTAMGQ